MWPTEYVEFKLIDELLQCGICYEYIDTSVMTLCSHNYCSLCIRKYLHYKTQCPICLEQTFEKDLRKNKILDEIITQFLNVKEKLEKKLNLNEVSNVKDENFGVVRSPNNSEYMEKQDVPDRSEMLYKNSDSPVLTDNNTTPHGKKNYQDVSTPSTSTECRIPSMFTPKSKKGFQNDDSQIVTCPVCKVDVSQNNINKHLDQCLKRENTKDTPKKSEPKRKPLPKLVLHLMKDNIIRKKLKELGLSSQGDRKILESRLQRYTVLYNAECDKIHPRPVVELIKQCEEEENLEKKVQKPSNRLNINRNTEHNIMEQQRKKYLAANKDSFNHLITKMKRNDNSQKLSVRRKILSKENPDVSPKDYTVGNNSTVRDNEESDFPLLDSISPHIEDSDSNATCPLQMYSSADPMKFLTVELSLSNDSIEQYTFNHDTPKSHKTSSILLNSIVKTENMKTEGSLSLENTLIHEEITASNRSRKCNFSEDRMDIDTIESVSEYTRIEMKNKERDKLFVKRSRSGTKYSSEECVEYFESKDRQRESRNNDTDSIAEGIEPFIEESDSIEIEDDYERESLHKKEYTSDRTNFEKENMESLDENAKACGFRKRERDMTFASSDEEKIEDRSTNSRKLCRLGLSEAKGFNNENFDEKTRIEENLQNEKEQLYLTRAKSTHFTRKSSRLRSKIS